MNAKSSLFYLSYLIPTIIVILSFWYFFIDGTLYYCWDKTPLIDFIPPFVHSEYVVDHFIAPPVVVYLIWLALVFLGFFIPYFLTGKLMHEIEGKTLEKHSKPLKRKKRRVSDLPSTAHVFLFWEVFRKTTVLDTSFQRIYHPTLFLAHHTWCVHRPKMTPAQYLQVMYIFR